jgi:hypothetical protein
MGLLSSLKGGAGSLFKNLKVEFSCGLNFLNISS